jgi:5-(carboxyamino)imidazole ribonucleotide synthase
MTARPVLGILGGGQLAQMMALAAIPLGIQCHVYDPDPVAPARLCAIHHCAAYDDTAALVRFAEAVDVITYEFENIPLSCVSFLNAHKPIMPGISALQVCQDRLTEKTFARSLGFATAPFVDLVPTLSSTDALHAVGAPAILKTRRMGYDGKGQQIVQNAEELDRARATYGTLELILEGIVPFLHEVSIISVRAPDGTTVRYPLIQNTHRHGILRTSIAPAPCHTAALESLADQIASTVLDAVGYVGVLTVECFVVAAPGGSTLVINEFAPRVHNSGHWSIEGATHSQFDYHVRAVMGLRIDPPELRGWSALCNLIGDEPADNDIPVGVAVHRYHKTPRPGRKVGHLTITTTDHATLQHTIDACSELTGIRIP